MFLLQILLRLALTVAVTWAMAAVLPQYLEIEGGMRGIVIVGVVLAVLNMTMRIPLDIITFPLRLFSSIIVMILINAAILWLAGIVLQHIEPEAASLTVKGGILGWVIVSCVFGILSWLIRSAACESDGH